jgi:drug/metabolite transporter (DMT)-like permease
MNSPTERFPPFPKILDYPALMTITFGVLFTGLLLLIAAKWDPTQGPLTISLLVVLAFIGTVAFCLFFTIPNDEITSAVVGGLVASFGAVIAFWLGKPRDPR